MTKLILPITIIVLFIISYADGLGNAPLTMAWNDFKTFHKKKYGSLNAEARHMGIFLRNSLSVMAHNLGFLLGRYSYTKELNKFADMDPIMFKKRNGFKSPPLTTWAVGGAETINLGSPLTDRSFPAEFDWRTKGKVSPVKDQGQCGSCWAFSSTGAMESQILIQNTTAQSLSEQQLIACDIKGNDQGCNGGMYTYAWTYIINTSHGIMSESAYPYSSANGNSGNCKFNSNSPIAQTLTSYQLVGQDETSMINALIKFGPLSIAIDASDWMLASSDIYSCGNKPVLDHAVLLVGYGTDQSSGKNYWIVKNSWGSDWGENGFFKLARGQGDCGITSYPAYPIL